MLARSAQVLAISPSSQGRFDISASQASQHSCVEARSARLAHRLALQPDALAQRLEDGPVRPAAAMLVVGDDLLAAGADDAEPRLPIRTVGGDAQLQDRVALARVLAVLQHEHDGAALGQGLVEEARAAGIGVDLGIEPRHHRARAARLAVGLLPRHLAPSPWPFAPTLSGTIARLQWRRTCPRVPCAP